MTLDQFQALKLWHQQHAHFAPLEKEAWEAVVTLWLIGCVGGPVALLIGRGFLAILTFALLFLPRIYVWLRRRLHRAGVLRCDWMAALR